MLRLQGVRKIAVLRANSIGDYVFSLPALESLRACYHDAEIVLLGKPWHAEFLSGRKGPVDRVIVVPPSRGIREGEEFDDDPAELNAFFGEMARESFDLALQMHGGGRYSNPFALRLGARLTAGLRAPEAAPLDLWLPYVYYQNEVLRYLEVVSLVGASAVTLDPKVHFGDQDRGEATRLLGETHSPLAILNPGASDFRRRWPVERFAAIGDLLHAAGFRVVLTGTPEESGLANSVIAEMRRPAEDFSGKTTLSALTGLLSLASIVVSNDTGTLHLAAAVGARTAGIFWCGNLINGGPLTRGRHRPIISWRTHCRLCRGDITTPDVFPRLGLRPGCDHAASFVDLAPLSEAVRAVSDLIEATIGETAARNGLLAPIV